jgi:hypothetical protein
MKNIQERRENGWNEKGGQETVCNSIDSQPVIKFFLYNLGSHNTLSKILTNKQTLWPLVHKRTILTERQPLVGEI